MLHEGVDYVIHLLLYVAGRERHVSIVFAHQHRQAAVGLRVRAKHSIAQHMHAVRQM
jgi:hypothetical protein